VARLKSVPLIERKAEVAALAEQEKAHLADCAKGNSCKELQEIRAQLKAGRAELASWFKPTEGESSLFDSVSRLGIERQGDNLMGRLLDNATGKQVGQIHMISADGEPEEWKAWLWKTAGVYPTESGGHCEAIAKKGDLGKLAVALAKRGVWWS
jgi:hypothetical protein